jgi:hypothetical protein
MQLRIVISILTSIENFGGILGVSFHVGHSPTRFYIIVRVFSCRCPQAANQPHSGGMLECGGVWTCAARLFMCPLKHSLTYKCRSRKDWRRRSNPGNMMEDISGWVQIWEDESSQLIIHMDPTPSYSIYSWASLPLGWVFHVGHLPIIFKCE